jgi:hypothetical protein
MRCSNVAVHLSSALTRKRPAAIVSADTMTMVEAVIAIQDILAV